MSNFKTTWQHIRRAPYQALAAIAVMTLNLFITCIFFTTAFSFEQVLRFFESRPQVTAFFKDEAKSEEIEAVKEKLLATGKVSSVKFVSKEEALAIYREQNKSEPLLLEMVTANMLPASLEVSTDKLSSLSESAISITLKSSRFTISALRFPFSNIASVMKGFPSFINFLQISPFLLM